MHKQDQQCTSGSFQPFLYWDLLLSGVQDAVLLELAVLSRAGSTTPSSRQTRYRSRQARNTRSCYLPHAWEFTCALKVRCQLVNKQCS